MGETLLSLLAADGPPLVVREVGAAVEAEPECEDVDHDERSEGQEELHFGLLSCHRFKFTFRVLPLTSRIYARTIVRVNTS